MMPEIFARIEGPEDLVEIPVGDLQKLIYPVSFYRNKAKHLKEFGRLLIERHGGKVPRDVEALVDLPGVGEKTAHVFLHRLKERDGFEGEGGAVDVGAASEGANKTVDGIGVDVHVHRISNRFGYIKTKTPHETEVALQKQLPRKYWHEYNSLLVNWGQNICRPLSPWCSKCPVFDLCKRVGVKKTR